MKQDGVIYYKRRQRAEAGKIVVHKSREPLPFGIIKLNKTGRWKYMCGCKPVLGVQYTSWFWKDVTCKNCLKKR